MEQQQNLGQNSVQPQQKLKSFQGSSREMILNRLVQKMPSDHSQQLSFPMRNTSSQILDAQNHFEQLLHSTRSSNFAGLEQPKSGNNTSTFNLRPQVSEVPMLRQQVEEPLAKKLRYPTMSKQSSPASFSEEQQVLMDKAPVKSDSGVLVYKPGMCAQRLVNYTLQMQKRPKDNNIEFWRTFVTEFFVPAAKKRWCVSPYRKIPVGVIKKEEWNCGICKAKPGYGFEITAEVLPRVCKIKYDSGTIKERYHLEMPFEYKNAYDQVVLQCTKVVHETVFQQLRVIHEGQLRIVFSSNLKICSWEFCAHFHEELIPRRGLVPLVSNHGVTAKKYQAAKKDSKLPAQEPETSSCEKFTNSAKQLTKALEPFVTELGYEKTYLRSLQISEALNCITDLVDCSCTCGTAPKESMVKFTRTCMLLYGKKTSGQQPQKQQQQQQQQQQAQAQPLAHNFITGQNSAPATSLHLSSQKEDQAKNPPNQLPFAGPSTMSRTAQLFHGIRAPNQFPVSGPSTVSIIVQPNFPSTRAPDQLPSAGPSTMSITAQPSHSFSMTPSLSKVSTQMDTSSLGGASSLASAAARLHISSHNSSMHLKSRGTELNDSASSMGKFHQDYLIKNSMLGGNAGLEGAGSAHNMTAGITLPIPASGDRFSSGLIDGNAGLEGAGSAHNMTAGFTLPIPATRASSSSGLMGMTLKHENTRSNLDHEDDFEKQLLFFIQGENAFKDS